MSVGVQIITGYMQGPHVSAGLADLYRKLEPLGLAYLDICKWKEEAEPLARRIQAAVAIEGIDRFLFVFHSYGVWKGCIVMNYLDALGVKIWGAFSADGVCKSPFRGPLTIPPNVERLWSYRQKENKIIHGSELIVSPATEWVVDRWVEERHNKIDALPELHAAVLCAAGGK